nr:TonB-dependent receptor [Acidobacteriota bacterium]
GGGGGRAGGAGGRGARGNQPQRTSVTLNAQLQYRRNDNEQNNLFPTLGGRTSGSALTVPLALNIAHRRNLHNVNVIFSRTSNASSGQYAFVEDVAGNAGIAGVAADPFAWGVPTLTFSSLSSVRDVAPSEREDQRVSLAYTLTRPWRNHTLRAGGDFRMDRASSRTDSNARGAFVFTGLYSSGGLASARGGGLDFADFLLGMPQQATLQYGPGNVVMKGRSMSLFLQDDWRKNAALTFNLGLRYELLWPFSEGDDRMVNLDVAPDFTAVAPVLSGQTGPFSGAFPAALLRADTNNIAPRVGFAWRAARATVVRGGYGISYNSGAYANIARQMVGQPPFAVTDTRLGTALAPLALSTAFTTPSPSTTTNSYGVDKNYALGVVQTWNADLSRDFREVWNLGANYTYTRGRSLDIVRAPNRGPEGLRIDGVQPFLWQTSEGGSELNAVAFRARRRPVRGLGFGATYTLAKSRDNASTIGGGGTVVAQDDQNLAAEWGLSSFDRRHQLSADVSAELPFGQNRPWLNNGGFWAKLLENWRVSTSFTWQSGTPYTPRIQGAAADVARGTTGTLRADYNGEPIRVNDPTIDVFFNTGAFSVPATGAFGSASRNMIIGPGSRQLDAQFSRDLRMGRTRVLSFQLNASNLLNMVNYSALDTVVNSPTFGQVLSVRPMRSMQANIRFRF